MVEAQRLRARLNQSKRGIETALSAVRREAVIPA